MPKTRSDEWPFGTVLQYTHAPVPDERVLFIAYEKEDRGYLSRTFKAVNINFGHFPLGDTSGFWESDGWEPVDAED